MKKRKSSHNLAKLGRGILTFTALLIVSMILNLSAAPLVLASNGFTWEVNSGETWRDNTDNIENDPGITIMGGELMLTAENAAGWWSFDEGDGIAIDNTDNQLHGQFINEAAYATGKFSYGITVDGEVPFDYVLVGDNAEFYFGAGSFTAMAWVKGTTPVYGTIVGKGQTSSNGWRLITRGDSGYVWLALRFSTGAINLTSTTDVIDETWHHVAGVVDKATNTGYVYVDGVNVYSTDITTHASGSVDSATDLMIGVNEGLSEPFKGSIDEVRVFNRVLSENEIRYQAGQTRAWDNLRDGRWVSTWHDFGLLASVDTMDITANIASGENIVAVVSVNSAASWDGVEDNATIEVSDGTNNYSVSKSGRYAAVTFILGTDNSNHGPRVSSFAINTSAPVGAREIVIENIDVDNNLMDRDIDSAEFGTITGTTISVDVEYGIDRVVVKENVHIAIYNGASALIDNATTTDNTQTSDNSNRYTLVFTSDNWSFADGALGGFDVVIRVGDNEGSDNTRTATDLFYVSDLTATQNVENLAGHLIWTYGTVSRVDGVALTGLENVGVIDNNMGDFTAALSGNDWENIRSPINSGQFYLMLNSENLDGVTDNLAYEFPNLIPTIVSTTISEALVDRKQDFAGSGAVTQTRITVVLEDNDGYADFITARIGVRDVLDAVQENNDVFSTATFENDNRMIIYFDYNPPDNLEDSQLGLWDAWRYAADNWSDIEGWAADQLRVEDGTTSFTFNPTNPYSGWTLEASGTISRVGGSTASPTGVVLIDNVHGTFNLGSGTAWSKSYDVTASPEDNVGVTLRWSDGEVDGLVMSSYIVSENRRFQIELRYENDASLVPDSENILEEVLTITDRNFMISFPSIGIEQQLTASVENIDLTYGGNVTWVRVVENDMYWRGRIPELQGGIIIFYLPTSDKNYDGLVYPFVLNLSDVTGRYSPPTGQILFRKMIENEYVEINDDFWDPGWTSVVWLTLGDRYDIAVKSDNAPFRVLGPFTAHSPYERIVQVFEIETPDLTSIISGVGWAAWRDGNTTVRVYYQDNTSGTVTVNVRIYDTTGSLMFELQPDNEWFYVTWNDATAENTYRVVLALEHSTLGAMAYESPVGLASEAYIVPGPDTSPSEDLGMPVSLASIISIVIVLAVGLAFDSLRAQIAAVAMAITATALWAIGWMPGTWYLFALVIILAVLFALSRRRTK